MYGRIADAEPKALFLRTYTANITILPLEPGGAGTDDIKAAGITLVKDTPVRFWKTASGIGVQLRSGETLDYDVLYPALGCDVHSELATSLGAACNPLGCLSVSDKQETSISGLYAAGDVVSDLHQLTVAEGHAAIAASAMHSRLPPNYR